jgi:hypothetical protein
LTKLTFFFYEKSMSDFSELFNEYLGNEPEKITIPLTKPSEDRRFTFGAKTYTNFAGFKKLVTDSAHAQGLSLVRIEREDYNNVVMIYADPDDYLPLLFIAGGDMKQQHETYLKLDRSHTPYAEQYKIALEEYWETFRIEHNNKFKAKFSVTKTDSVRVTVSGLANLCHIRSIHQKGALLQDTIRTSTDPFYDDFPLSRTTSQSLGRREP